MPNVGGVDLLSLPGGGYAVGPQVDQRDVRGLEANRLHGSEQRKVNRRVEGAANLFSGEILQPLDARLVAHDEAFAVLYDLMYIDHRNGKPLRKADDERTRADVAQVHVVGSHRRKDLRSRADADELDLHLVSERLLHRAGGLGEVLLVGRRKMPEHGIDLLRGSGTGPSERANGE